MDTLLLTNNNTVRTLNGRKFEQCDPAQTKIWRSHLFACEGFSKVTTDRTADPTAYAVREAGPYAREIMS